MANITRRENKDGTHSYLIRVYSDTALDGKQLVKVKTWHVPENVTERSEQKELNRQATLFEEQVKKGLVAMDGKTKFADYAASWMESAQLAPKTRTRYEELLVRINQAIGHIRLEKLQAHHLEEFYKNLAEPGIKEKGCYAVSPQKLEKQRTAKKTTKTALAKVAGVAPATVGSACAGQRISIEKAALIAKALGTETKNLFDMLETSTGLSDKTILHHHRLICAILEKAKRERNVPFNVAAEHATAPKVQRKEAKYLDDTQAREMVSLLLNEPDIRAKTSLMLLLYSGLRRGELCGLEWGDVDLKNGLVNVCRASQYQPHVGIVEVPTKNESSERMVHIPEFMVDLLREYRRWWAEYKLKLGDYWKGESDRLFVQDDGKPINPDTINFWLDKFTEKNGLEHLNPHALRHTFATLQIAAGVDLRTLQARTGHAQASTLMNIYSHAIRNAEEAATDALDDMLTPAQSRQHNERKAN